MSDAQEKSRVARFLDSELFYNFRHSPTAIAGAAIVLLVSALNMVGQLLRSRFDVRREVRA